MVEMIRFVRDAYTQYSQNAWSLVVVWVALILVCVSEKMFEKQRDLMILSAVSLGILVFPVSACFLAYSYFDMQADAYAAIFQMLPVGAVAAAVFTVLYMREEKRSGRIVVLTGLFLFCLLNLNTKLSFQAFDPEWKRLGVQKEILEVCRELETMQQFGEVKVMASAEVSAQIKEYSGLINVGYTPEELYQMGMTEAKEEKLPYVELGQNGGCNYIIIPKEQTDEEAMTAMAYGIFLETDRYVVLVK